MADSGRRDERFGGDEAGIGDPALARAVVLPAPLEATVSYGGGTARGPAAILRASGELEFVDEESGRPYWALGEVATLPRLHFPVPGSAAVDRLAAAAAPTIERGAFLLTLGGEHTVTAGPFRAAAARHPGLGIVGIDAHLDLRDRYGGSPWSHACVLRRIVEEHGPAVLWAGVRSVSAEEWSFLADQPPGRRADIRWAHALDREGSWIEEAIERLPPEVYLTIDVDGLDPSVIPGTGTPEPGGLDYRTVLRFVRTLAARRRIVAADFVELAPLPAQQGSEFTTAKLAAKLLGAVLSKR